MRSVVSMEKCMMSPKAWKVLRRAGIVLGILASVFHILNSVGII